MDSGAESHGGDDQDAKAMIAKVKVILGRPPREKGKGSPTILFLILYRRQVVPLRQLPLV